MAPAILFRALETVASLSQNASVADKYGWGDFCAAGLEVHDLEGNHFEVFNKTNEAQILAALKLS